MLGRRQVLCDLIHPEKGSVPKKEIKAKVAAEQQPSEADLTIPGHSKGEAWTINMPAHVLEGYAQKGRSDIKDHQLTQEKDEEENDSESEDEEDEVAQPHGTLLIGELLRLEQNLNTSILSRTSGLLLVYVANLGGLGDGLPVADLGGADVGLNVELALHALDIHLEVQLAHAVDERLPQLRAVLEVEGRVFLVELVQSGGELVLLAPVLHHHATARGPHRCVPDRPPRDHLRAMAGLSPRAAAGGAPQVSAR